MATWILRLGRGPQVFPLTPPGPINIGRDASCEVALADPACSRVHCRLHWRDHYWELHDAGSHNGTLLNGRRVTAITPLRDGDVLHMGDTELTYAFVADDDETRTAQAQPSPVRARPPAPPPPPPPPPPPAAADFDDTPVEGEEDWQGPPSGGRLAGVPLKAAAAGSGELFAGHYQLKKIIHRGSSGVFHLATDPASRQRVCVKIFHGVMLENDPTVQRFVRGVWTAAKLRHPNIVKLFRAGRVNGQLWVAMEYVDGPSVRDIVAQYGVAGMLSPVKVIRIAKDIASALALSSEQGIVHRNIRPDNILLTKKEQAKLSDFSLTRRVTVEASEAVTATAEVVGDVALMPPEAFYMDQDLDFRSDQYSLGACLYWLLAGRKPFDGAGTVEIIGKVLNDAPRPPSTVNMQVPRPLETIVLRLLAKAPGDRYKSMAALETELYRVEQFLGH